MQLPAFTEAFALTRWERTSSGWRCAPEPVAPLEEGDKADYASCVLGLRDYVEKNGFKGVVLAFRAASIPRCVRDRRRCARCRARARGDAALQIHLEESLADAAKVAKALAIRYDIAPIESAVLGLEQALAPMFKGCRAT
jgi:NAD+ synthase